MIERRTLGRTGLDVSVLGFGGSEIGFERTDVATVRRLLDDALDGGLNVVDTAECYADSEALLGEAVAGRRGDVHLFTKCGHFEGTGRDDWRSASLGRSLARRRTVDLLQLHTCSEDDLRRGDVMGGHLEAPPYSRRLRRRGDPTPLVELGQHRPGPRAIAHGPAREIGR